MLAADRNTMREELLKEVNGAARSSTAVARTGHEAPRAPGPLSTSQIAARNLDRLERSGA